MALTPMMQQYFNIKEQYKDCILFYRLGDFYEMFFEDAEKASKELELVLTGRDCGLPERAPMCGIPYHASNNYISRLINKGYKVAICEQVEDPALAKGIVKRDVIRVITPGTFNEDSYLQEDKNNFIMSIYKEEIAAKATISYVDITTGELYTTEFEYSTGKIVDEIYKIMPTELLITGDLYEKLKNSLDGYGIYINEKAEDFFLEDIDSVIESQFNSDDYSETFCRHSIGSLLKYILETQKTSLSNISNAERYYVEEYMSIDINSRRNLELTESLREKTKKGSLLWILDKTTTSMGGRNLRKWVEEPLLNKKAIEKRLNGVEDLWSNLTLCEDLKEALKNIYDIERISGKIASKNVNARELLSLKNSLMHIPRIKEIISSLPSKQFKELNKSLEELKHIVELIDTSIKDDPSIVLKEGNLIKEGYNNYIDELREAKLNGKKWIANLEAQERLETGIKSLKVGYNKVFGYYIEISKANYSSIPEGRYIRKQTLANAERFITEDLKEMENKILGAEEKLVQLEYEEFVKVREEVEKEIAKIKKAASIISQIDSLLSLAIVARENNYIKPTINNSNSIMIKEGRHPVVERMLPKGNFVSNDCKLDSKDDQLLIITGPNMAGKSTYMRQVALIAIMGQIGSFVPATEASLSINDKIFTRIGASDDLAGGKSTFMVEMAEVSNILQYATKNSLVILDEVGRGTSTYDGLSIAWSVIEYLAGNSSIGCKTLFATHYHELTRLEDKIKGIKNYSVAVKEVNNTIVFLRKIIPGGADQSYGIEVAKLAGLPEEVISRAKDILKNLEGDSITSEEDYNNNHYVKEKNLGVQLGILDYEKDIIINSLKGLDTLNMTPMEALNTLHKLVQDSKSII